MGQNKRYGNLQKIASYVTIFNLVMTYELDTYIIWVEGGGGNHKKSIPFPKSQNGFF